MRVPLVLAAAVLWGLAPIGGAAVAADERDPDAIEIRSTTKPDGTPAVALRWRGGSATATQVEFRNGDDRVQIVARPDSFEMTIGGQTIVAKELVLRAKTKARWPAGASKSAVAPRDRRMPLLCSRRTTVVGA